MTQLPDNAILVGPWCAGKTTLGRQAAEDGATFVDLDDIAESYWAEIGYDLDRLLQRNRETSIFASEIEWEPARMHAVQRGLDDHPTGILALGAACTNYTDNERFVHVRAALESDPRPVVLITPSLDEQECEGLTQSRAWNTRGSEWVVDRHDFDSWAPTELDLVIADGVIITRYNRKKL